jgi:hypothetical protein
MLPSYPDVLVKKTENDYLLCGKPISRAQFLGGMKRCGFDLDITTKTLCLLAVGGEWHLSLCDSQKYLIFRRKPSSPSVNGFK